MEKPRSGPRILLLARRRFGSIEDFGKDRRQKMNILVACEMSGVVREAFRKLGHNAYSCDLIPALDNSPFHIQGDAFDAVYNYFHGPYHQRMLWDMMIACPPCTRLTVAGARWFKGKEKEQQEAIHFVETLWEAPIPKIAIENPIGVLSTRSVLGKPTQIIQPWMFGHGETKATCLWLKNLTPLVATNIVAGREPRIHKESPGMKNGMTRAQRRSLTYQGIADAMAAQWG
jgi:hypothetical protein